MRETTKRKMTRKTMRRERKSETVRRRRRSERRDTTSGNVEKTRWMSMMRMKTEKVAKMANRAVKRIVSA